MKKACSISGCGAEAKARGWCSKHYQKWAKYSDAAAGKEGTPAGAPMLFIERAVSYDGDECLIWPYGVAGAGYGVVDVGGVQKYAHRIVCKATKGPPPSEKHEVAHGCGNGSLGCLTKRHLRWATRAENFADKLLHGTDNRGDKSSTKLSSSDVLKIRSRYAVGGISQTSLGREFGVGQSYVSQIIRGVRWGHLS